jgi:hypothetical protein
MRYCESGVSRFYHNNIYILGNGSAILWREFSPERKIPQRWTVMIKIGYQYSRKMYFI